MMPNIVGKKFLLSISNFDQIQIVDKYLSWYKDKSLRSKTQDIPYFIKRNKEYKFNPNIDVDWFWEYCPEHLINPIGSLYSFNHLLDYAIILETNTQKGEQDMYIYIEFTKQREISVKHFDFLGKNGNLERVKSEFETLFYIQEVSNIKSSFNVLDRVMCKAKSKEDILRIIHYLMIHKKWKPADFPKKFLPKAIKCIKNLSKTFPKNEIFASSFQTLISELSYLYKVDKTK